MRRRRKRGYHKRKALLLIGLSFLLFLLASALFLRPTYADPALKTISQPSNYVDLNGKWINEPNAWDWDNSTYADETQLKVFNHIYWSGFNTTDLGPISRVDLRIVITVTGLTNDYVTLKYYVGGVEGDPWTSITSSVTQQCFSLDNTTEPNDGSWSWADLSNLEIRQLGTQTKGPDPVTVYRTHEVWAVVYYGQPPGASFSYTPEYSYTGETVTFNASDSYDPDGSIVSYEWNFGDGTNGTGEITTHVYANDGKYTVTLNVTDNHGLSDTTSKGITVLNRPPTATFTESADTIYTAEPVTFNASDSYDPDGTIVSYSWDFGDGSNSTGVIVDHSYVDDGTYTVNLTVTDDDGGTASASATKTILNRSPVAIFTESATTMLTSEVIYFNASDSYDPDGTIVSYFWDFGDGTNATGVIVDHLYTDDGNYTVTLTVTDDDGATDTATSTKTVLNRPPVASFTESAETVYIGEVLSFNASASYDPDGWIVSYFWDFGDGSNATGLTTEHSYSLDGNYTVTLTVTDNDGATNSISASKTVLNRPPVPSFRESAETVYTGDTIYFNASDSYDPDGTIVSYFWDFGDGTNATGVIVDHLYTDDGNYTVTLTVTDDDGATDSATASKIVLNRPPAATFTESAETVYTNTPITFNSTDSYDPDGVIVSYFWDFGDGNNATGAVVSYAYADDGNYTVTLTVTDDDGAIDIATATKTVLNQPPLASFTESAETVSTGETIYFNASSSSDPDGIIVSYFWDFGDGTNATGVIVDHSYVDDGNYTVTLTVTDDDGATDSTTATKTVLNRPPVAVFTESAEIVYTDENLYFNASASYDSDGSIVSYWWDFGDGTNATGVTTEHSYPQEGNYTVTLTVTDDDGATDTATSTKTVLNRPPVALFTESSETVYTNEIISFNASDSYDPDGTIVNYFWSFDDGANTTGVVVEHAYADDGNYTVTLTVTDDDGATGVATATKTVLNRSPIASFTESAETVYTSVAISFNASASYDLDGSIVSYFWDFGDGTNATGLTVNHAYADDGNYTVTLTVTDDDGATDITSSTKTVLNRSPVASFTESAARVYTGETITFNASASYDQDGSIVSYFWDFGDATNATGVVASHSYADDGNYTVTLTVTDHDGATDTTTATKTVLNRPPVALFTESAETVLVSETIYFNASGSYDPDGSIVSYFWDFGDGTNATGITTEHAYADNGFYTVTLTVTDNDGATNSRTATKNVEVTPPVAIFTESAENAYTGGVIYFNASDSYDPDGYIVSYFWDFGDGFNATGVTVNHAYADDGNYTVTLTVTDEDGATDTATSTKTVLNRPPAAIFTESAETVYTGDTITFNASDSYDPDGSIVSYFWNFGDGTNATGVVVSHAYADDGNYTVTITVTDDDGATDAATSTKTALNRSPVAIFTESAETVYTGDTISFNASSSYDPDGTIVSYFWDFGDSTNATGVAVEHAYADDGNYTVTLTVTDNDSATDTATSTKTILNKPPVASFIETATTVYTNEVITFNASASYDPDGYIVSYFWDFGDGSNATGVVVNHAYVDDGVYNVTLTVTDDDGATASASASKTILNRLPVASFTESSTTVLTGEVIHFNASASYDPDGYIVSYFWDFGDGTNATGAIVDHSYVDDGNYTVTLTVTDDDGATDVASATKTVLNRPPVASFTESAETVDTDETITFNASVCYDPDGTIVSYFWDFGDGTNATGVIVEHSYVDDGVYNVTLTVTDDDGATDTTTATKTVVNRPPVAAFTESAITVLTSEVIYFNASASYDPDGSIVSYFWDFGDGTNASGVLVDHAYADDGNYTVTLTVTDDDGAIASAGATKTVLNRPPVAVFAESAETVYTDETITFNASYSYDPDGSIVSYFWDFGDGSNATGVVVDYSYAEDGNYTVTLTVTDDDDATASISATKTVLNKPPVALFTESAETVYTGETIIFNASDSYDPDGTIVSYFWDFGDGTNATGVALGHSYADDGNYTVTLTVTDDDSATGTSTSTKAALNRSPIALFTESATTVITNEVIYFNSSESYDPDGSIVSYFWDFGDGTNATGVTVDHSYADDGNYTVTLIVIDDDGATASTSATKTVLNRPPVASFTESEEIAYTNETITFNATESYDPDGVIVSYFWDFGDGTNTTGIIVNNAYDEDGNYTVTLTVTDDDGAIASTTATKTVLNSPPVALFTESAETVYTSEVITFNASASYDPDGTIVSYFWDFGDGTNTTGVTVDHSYTDDGNYTVTLTVTDDDGATDSAMASKTVLNRLPVATFTESATTVYTNDTITFNATDSYDPDGVIVSYFWDFGDGTNTTSAVVSHAYADDGNYTVTLTITDDDGATDTATATKTVLNRSPLASFTESAETVYTGEIIYFNASGSSDPDGYIVSYFWDFGDDTNATGVTVDHAYVNDGNYTVTLTVTDDDGATDSATATKTVLNRPPVTVFTESLDTVYTNETIHFNASDSYDPDGSIISYFWDFGDGTNATGGIVEHSYVDDGNYTVTLTVTDDDGATASTSAVKTVLNRPPVALFTESSGTVYTGDAITFNASGSYDPDGSIVSYFWDFGDATNATGVVVSHAYADDGNYTVTLTATDNDGAIGTATSTKTVLNRPPIASFTESAETVLTGEYINFNASASYDPDGSIVSYFWDFGDGTNASGVSVDHAYADDGNYTVTLTVTDDDGATDTATATKTVLNRPPAAIFTESSETVYTGDIISFNASSSYDPDGSIVSYFWNFGDGTNATGVVAEHAYADDGNYTVTLTITDNDGATDTATSTKTILNKPPAASFSETAEMVYTNEVITFNASASYDSDGYIVSYFWDFGDGSNATGVIVDHAYADDGVYNVTLTVTDDDGATASASASKTILNRPPVASFTESSTTVLTGEVIQFNASTSYDPDGSIVSYFWNFGDGTNATGGIVEHSYVDDGNYTVTLTVTDDDGATDVATATKMILNRPPVASFTESAETVDTSETITFNASDSYDPDGTIVSYLWDFGDGTNATGAIVNHSYVDDGNYTVTLTVTDDDGATNTATAVKSVLNRSPVASFTESAEIVLTGETIYFNASDSYDPDGSIVSYYWDFGDGSNASGVIVDHSYADDGNYVVTLTVTDDDGATASTSATKTVLNRPPVAIFTESAETVYTGETITFNASDSYDPDGSIVSYFWDFGDGTNATGVVVNHSYTEDGNYIVTLTVTDDDGATASTSSTKTVLNRPPVAAFTESADTVYTGENIAFNASDSYDPDGTIVSYFWDFGDGSNATGVTVDHSYVNDGNYTVTLTVTDNDGATDTATSTKTVLNRAPVASFTESATTVLTNEVIYFNASESYDPDGSIVSYFWDFGDATNATGVVVSHAYADDGNYTVTLTVTDDDGATDSAVATKMVLNRPPVASFTESATTVLTGETIYFNASESYDPDGSIVTYFWNFGDGTNATGVTVNHSYVDDGNYTVTLTVTDDDEAMTSTSATKIVLNRPPVASFTESAEIVYTGETITFNATASYDLDGTIVSYFWDFGDGTNTTGAIVTHSYVDNGNYTVTLIVTDDDGATDSAVATKTVLDRSPVASFTESAETVYTQETITFNASASYDPDGSIVSYFWDFGDGTNATGVTAEHAYVEDGIYTVTLTITDDDGATTSASSTKTVLNRPPVASFTESKETAYTGVTITFDASASYDPDGSIVSYFWDFGDGTNATGVTLGHSYADDGNYTVTLTVTDNDGATGTATSTKTILNRSPVASFTESATQVYTGTPIYFDASDSYDPDGIIVSYFWDFGDGTNATGVTVEHAYVDDGSYVVTLTVTDDDGATGVATATKKALNRAPVASFTESAETVYTSETITFNASESYDPDGSIVSYFWDFGDGTNATGVVVEDAYGDHDVYTVTLTVTDDDGATASTSATKTVLNRPPVALFTESAESVVVGEVIYFNASDSYDQDGYIVSYFWDFGDGINATGVTAEHAYADVGIYTVTLTVTDDDGATASTSATKTVGITPPVAIFTESAETVLTGEVIYFNASDSYDPDGVIVSYFWDFGDGTNATGVTADHAYADDGNYTVTLTVTDDDGATDTASSTKTVLNRPPVAIFSESAETVYTGEAIAFNASTSYDPDGSIVSYFWDFGDGTNATGETVDHAYADDGNYTITLTVTDDDGATDMSTSTKTVLNRPPVASFTETAETVYTGEVITFNASSSYDPDGSIVSYFWDFGDGTNGTGMTVDHLYTDDGNYTVTLTVTDDDSATASTSATKNILNRPPVATFTESAETIYTGDTIAFNASESYDPDGTIVSYFWDFGDGTNSTGVTVTHSYADDGTYTVTLTVTDDDGATDTSTSTKTILNRAPVAAFTESASTVYTSEAIYFNASDSVDPDGVIISYLWDFGDGTNATGVTVNHAYSDDGNYTVTLTVTDDDGVPASATAIKTVLNRPPAAIFAESSETVYTGETITFNASDSYDPDGSIATYFWDFGDGSNTTGIIVEHSYVENGNYTVTLTVTDDNGATDTATATKTVLNRPPVPLFTESAETVLTGEVITFNASGSYDPDGVIVSYFWDFGDGENATGVVVSHSYVNDGNYTVTLTVTDDDGASASASATKTVLNRSPVASFTESAENVVVGEAIYFNASASYDQDGSIVSYFWDFGDGTNGTGVTTEHAYADNGLYTVTLTVTDDDGAVASTSATKTVEITPPVAIFTETAETVYTDEVITFNASDSYDPDGVIVSYFWDFGDATNATGVVVNHAYADDGNYTVTLTVTDDDGAIDTATSTKTVLNRSPVASFTESATTVFTGEVIYFNASDSYDPDGTIVSYFWDFGDGTNATGVVVDHAYVDDGNYTVSLTLIDDDGATDTTTSSKIVLNRPPVASFTESAETVLTSEVITFNASDSYDPDGFIVSYFWDFGDGSNTTGVVVEHGYSEDGNYTVTLTVTDDDGASSSSSATKIVLNRPPIASFTESVETVYTAEVIAFNASASYDPDGSIVSYFWDFGDGTNATGVVVDHAYVDDGNYTVSLTLIDDDGATDTTTSSKTVLNRPPVASFTESGETVLVGENIYFNASDSYDPDGTIVGYFWDFGDGTNATGVTAEHAYSIKGTYIVILVVTDDDGATASANATKTVGNNPPVATFTESKETAYTGATITFDASASYDPDGSIVSYFWDFGDGTNATGVSLGHSYGDDGNYTVTLTVTDNDGATSTATSTKTILNRSPVASFTESATQAYTGKLIYFDASDSYDPDGAIVSHFWDFGDGANATGVTVEHAYADDGSYAVKLTVTDDDGATGVATATKKILNRAPLAVFTESAGTVYTEEVIYFNASGSYDSDGVIVSYFWDFGDGTNATGETVEHAYADDGSYTVTLTVTDDDDATASTSATKTILNRPPVASFTESAETVLTWETITFNASGSYDQDGYIVTYFWDFGDGTNATGIIVDHAYADGGNYTATLTVTDDDDAAASVSATKEVLNRPPVASFTESATTALTGEVIYFNASASYDPDGYIVSFFWNFGDGTNATGGMVDHAYADDGNYTVTLTVTDDDGAIDTAASTKTVLNRSPVALFIESSETVFVNETIYFNASGSYDPDGTIVSFFWDFGDGTNATGVVVDHAYADNGNYTVMLTVTDNDGATASVSATKTVLTMTPIAIFSESAETLYTGKIIKFNASESYDPDGYIIDYFWDFGDGTNSTGVTVEHTYMDDGNYTVTLMVTDDDGATASQSATKTILNRSPNAFFTYSPEFPIVGEIATFNASDSYDSDGYILNYTWSFGDGNLTTVATSIVTHVYAAEGNFTVILTIMDDDAATDNATDIVMIRNYPTAAFSYSPDRPAEGEPMTFNASSSTPNGGVLINYEWNFGDGNITAVTEPIITHTYAMNGSYSVTLTVTDSEVLSDSESKLVRVGKAPVASFTYSPTDPYVGDTVTFDSSASYDPDGYIVSYWWDFGDGSSPVNETNPTITHVYAADGNYTVTLIVTDNDEITARSTNIVTIFKAPLAAFTYTPDFPIAGETIVFNASESYDPNGYIISYEWDFGDGNTTTVTTILITHVYETEGNYTVTLNITDNDGYVDITSDFVNIRNYPYARFTHSPNSPTTGQNVSFDAKYSEPRGGVILYYLWDFGDETPLKNVAHSLTTHSYTDAGTYNVTLTVTDSEGLSDTASRSIKVIDYPEARFTYSPQSPIAGETTITFNASSSTPNHGSIISYKWDFGDGNTTTVTDPIIIHIYSVAGNYTVILTVTDNEGLSDSTSKLVSVRPAPPVASFTYYPEFPARDDIITFNASNSYDPDGLIVSYRWDFADGDILTVATPIIQHSYAEVGNYTVVLNVTDNDGLTDTALYTVGVRGYPVASFTYSPENPEVQKPTTFNASASTPDGGVIVNYEWNFGDGNITATTYPSAIHYYETFGSYTVTLNVTDSEGLWDTESKTLKVIAPPEANFSWSPTHPKANETVTFDASTSTPNGGTIAIYRWDFGDGMSHVFYPNPTITHQYTSPGNYLVTLNVTDSEGLWDTISKIVSIGAHPQANFTWSPRYPQAYESVIFNASASQPNGGAIVSYEWNFGDGNVTIITNPIIHHHFTGSGNYTVTLNVTDSEDLWDIESETVAVAPAVGPHAEFDWSPPSPHVNETITFNASTSTPNGGEIINYLWDFGDSNITVSPDPVIFHVYLVEGNYTVLLNVTDSQGLWSTKSRMVNISGLHGPTANFTWNPSAPMANQTVSFNASSSTPGWNGTHYPPIVSYIWDFGDGNITEVYESTISHIYRNEGHYNVTLTIVDSNGSNNSLTQTIEVTSLKAYDLNDDGKIDGQDLFIVSRAFGTQPGDELWNPVADVNGDGKVDGQDLFLISRHYGEEV